MVGVFENFGIEILQIYREFISVLPPFIGSFLNFLILVLSIVLYSLFIWKFYRFISKKDPLGLNLNKYNKSENSLFTKLLAGIFYFIEYILILPFLIFIIFAIFTIFLIVLTQNQNTTQVLMISAIVIAAIRMVSYYKESLSQEIAKLLPLTLLAVSVLDPNLFSETLYLERVFSQINQIPDLTANILSYLGFIIILEIILRFFDFIFSLFGIEEIQEEKE